MTDGPWSDFQTPPNAGPWTDFQKSASGSAADVVKSAGVGTAEGAIGLAGLPGDVQNLISSGLDKLLGPRAADAKAFQQSASLLPGSQDIQKKIEGLTGEFYKPQTMAGEYAQTAGQFLPAMLGGPESLLMKLGTRVAAPAIMSETAGQLTKGTAAEPYARVGGALASPLALSAARRVVTPLPATAERNALANNLRAEGVDLTAGQATGSKPLQWMESTFGDMPGSGGRAAQIQTNQGEQFTNAALRRTGENANRASPEVIDGAFRRIGGQFDDLASRNTLAADRQLGNDLVATERDYNGLVSPSQRAPVIGNTIRDIGDVVAQNGGHITGEQYNAFTSRIARQARASKNDPQLQEALTGIRGSLDDAMERSLQAAGNAPDLAAWREARNQYRNLMVIEKAATGAGAATAEGILSPSQLRNATVGQNRRAYARGQGDFADLARSGEAIMKPLPNSGTAPRQFMQHAISAIGSMMGGAAGSAAGPAGTVGGMAAGLAAPGVAGRVLMSRPVQAYLGNQMLPATQPGARPDPRMLAILNAYFAAHPQITDTRNR